jgi:uncharacterized protein
MRPFYRIFLLWILVLTYVGPAYGQEKSGLLWKVSGNGLAKDSYLYGTIHIICKENFLMNDQITAAFDQTEQLILELDMSDPQLMNKMQQVSLNPGMKNIQGDLDPEAAKTIDAFLLKNYGAGLAQLGVLKPFVLTSMVLVKTLPCAETESYEGFFTTKAGSASKPVMGLETVEYQVGVFDQIPQDIQLKELGKMLTDESTKQETEKLMSTYLTQDVEALFGLMNSSEMMSQYRGLMLDDRNKAWIPKISEAMKSKSVFVAVGAGHLGGENGVISLLKQAGYTVEPVK